MGAALLSVQCVQFLLRGEQVSLDGAPPRTNERTLGPVLPAVWLGEGLRPALEGPSQLVVWYFTKYSARTRCPERGPCPEADAVCGRAVLSTYPALDL